MQMICWHAALVCSSRDDMVLAARIFDEIVSENDLTMSVPKTKLQVAGIGLTVDDLALLELARGGVEVVEQFKYLGLLVEARGGVVGEVSHQIVQACRAFGSLRDSVFRLGNADQEACILICSVGVLLYGAET